MKKKLIYLSVAFALALPLFAQDKESDRVENAGR